MSSSISAIEHFLYLLGSSNTGSGPPPSKIWASDGKENCYGLGVLVLKGYQIFAEKLSD
jgi:hypothetical protein